MAIRRAWCIALILLAARSPEAAAQGVARSFEQLQLLVKAGDTVSVRDAVGAETTGRIERVSSSTLTLETAGRRRDFREPDVAAILQRRSDSLANGALWGLAFGLTIGGIGAAAMCYDGPCDASVATVVPMTGGIGAAIGVAVDALITRRQTIYHRAGGPATFRMAPLLGHRRRGVALWVRF